MLNLLTGQPGNGKTLWIIRRILDMCAKESRPVFYSGIPLTDEGKAKLGWTELGDITSRVESFVDPEDNTSKQRFTLPPNSIVVIDECQRIYRVRPQGASVPAHVAAFETHRHQGLDFFLITQHPQLLDTAVRKLAGYHFHVRRPSGLDKTNVYEWEQCETDPLSERSRKLARTSVWKFDRSLYPYYVSSEAHTHKRNLPLKQIAAVVVAALVVVGSASYTARHVMSGAGVTELVDKKAPASTEIVSREGSAVRSMVDPWSADVRAPRIAGYERTAPLFDPLQRPKSQPKIAGCMQFKSDKLNICRCTTEQGSVLNINSHECARLVKEGWFDETRSVVSAKEENIRYLNSRDGARGDAGEGEGPLNDAGAGV